MWPALRLFIVALLALASFAAPLAIPARGESALTSRGLAAFSFGQFAQALQAWQQAAEAGDGEAALYVGVLHELGHGVQQSASDARSWYERAAALGNAVAMFNLGVLFDSGTGVERDRTQAVHWYRQAATHRMARAAYALGLMYRAGDGVDRDRKEAIRYFQQALAGGVTAARDRLAELGATVATAAQPPANEAERDAGMTAFERAQRLLLRRTPEAAKEAATLLRRAADNGDLLAAYNLAYCYDRGIGLQADARLAYVWYGRAVRSPVETVRGAARAGMVSIAVRLDPAQLAEAQAILSEIGRTQ